MSGERALMKPTTSAMIAVMKMQTAIIDKVKVSKNKSGRTGIRRKRSRTTSTQRDDRKR